MSCFAAIIPPYAALEDTGKAQGAAPPDSMSEAVSQQPRDDGRNVPFCVKKNLDAKGIVVKTHQERGKGRVKAVNNNKF